jgi:hypothetical protein
MTVVVNKALLSKRLGPDDEARISIWSQSGHGADDPCRIDFDGRERQTVGNRSWRAHKRGAA